MRRGLAVLAVALTPVPALAHPGTAEAHGFLVGFLHPLGGWDHIAAMLAIGLWAGLSGGAARRWLPAGFLAGMMAGGLLGLGSVALPAVEAGLLASVVVLGVLVALAARVPLGLAVPLVAAFGLLHGHAHGVEAAEGGLGYVAGFMTATLLLHAGGLVLSGSPARRQAVRLAGAGGAMIVVALAALA